MNAAAEKTYRLNAEAQAECPQIGPALLARIDSRLTWGGSYVHKYAPITDTGCGVDMSLAFEDTWGEVEPYQPR